MPGSAYQVATWIGSIYSVGGGGTDATVVNGAAQTTYANTMPAIASQQAGDDLLFCAFRHFTLDPDIPTEQTEIVNVVHSGDGECFISVGYREAADASTNSGTYDNNVKGASLAIRDGTFSHAETLQEFSGTTAPVAGATLSQESLVVVFVTLKAVDFDLVSELEGLGLTVVAESDQADQSSAIAYAITDTFSGGNLTVTSATGFTLTMVWE